MEKRMGNLTEMTDDFIDACNYATLFRFQGTEKVVHIILTEEISTPEDILSFYDELNTDPEFGLAGKADLLEHIIINKAGEIVR